MNVQFLSNEKGEKTAAVIPIEYWNKIKKQLEIEAQEASVMSHTHRRAQIRKTSTKICKNP